MLFDTRTGAALRQAKLIFAVMFLVWLSLICGIGYIAIHFITKFW